jgi:hypothetical protein
MPNPPAFQFYPADFLADENVVMMSNQALGCYIKLMCYCWREGSIPADQGRIAKLCGEDSSAMAQLWLSISPCFSTAIDDPSRLVHPRLDKERQKQLEFRKERAESGLKGSAARWKKRNGSAMAKPMAEPMANHGSSSSSSSSSSDISIASRRNPLLDALVAVDDSDPTKATSSAFSSAAKALKEIKAVSPEVTPDEIARRAENYRKHMPGVTISPHALAKHWAKCERPPAQQELVKVQTVPVWKQIENIQARINNHPANPDWAGYYPGRHTDAQVAEFKALKEQIAKLKSQIQ